MRVLQDLVLLSLLLLSISKVYSQEDKKTKELFNLVDIYLMDMHWIETKYDLISPAILYSIIFPAVID